MGGKGRGQLIGEVIAEAEDKFDVFDLARGGGTDRHRAARAWAMTELARRGASVEEIAAAMSCRSGTVREAIGLSLDDGDEDEIDEPPLSRPASMRPVAGERRDCASESDCLAELLRACAPKAPRHASCPPDCARFRPPGALEHYGARAGMGSWDDASLPPDPDPDPDGERWQKRRVNAAAQPRQGGRFAQKT